VAAQKRAPALRVGPLLAVRQLHHRAEARAQETQGFRPSVGLPASSVVQQQFEPSVEGRIRKIVNGFLRMKKGAYK